MTGLRNWYPMTFEAAVERAYQKRMHGRFIPLGRLALVTGMAAFVGFLAWDVLLDPSALARTAPIRLGTVLYMAAIFGMTFLPTVRRVPAMWPYIVLCTYIGVAAGSTLALAELPGGFLAGSGSLVLGMIFVPALVSGAVQASIVLLPYLGVSLLVIWFSGGTRFEMINAFAWSGGGIVFSLGFTYLLDIINRRRFDLERQLETEKQRSDALLLNILPAQIASRLTDSEEPLVDNHENVSVLFADIAGFTRLSRDIPAADLLALLNDLFSRFDRLVEQHGAEKIKTIGDAYMVATGLSGGVADHAAEIADLALAMRQAFAEFREQNRVDLKLRIGVHSGAVIAGVIGRKKFAYDLWGYTVNVASRMESEGVPDRIQISAETKKMLSGRYRTAPRGEIEIRGHGPRKTYFLEGRTSLDAAA
ncbi:adenylate/guanylate cyclase domain-containing protein [Oceanibacterium hippocampi]|uniref:Adenylate cyclase n=1 Tax=Oceanibacterium hippocampi TaxID=745714 RepID=A0A1Y5U3M4_9PROT|nr:adenylate/guanylate cyclase domain-containing protein [Oceanibacterium hippocampi]SLN76040.1 Adenylate cyclase [Oceanibacterium hippocampi]